MVQAMVKCVTHNIIDAVCDDLTERLFQKWIPSIVDENARTELFLEDGTSAARREELDDKVKKLNLVRQKVFKMNDQTFKPAKIPTYQGFKIKQAADTTRPEPSDENRTVYSSSPAVKPPMKKRPPKQREEYDDEQ